MSVEASIQRPLPSGRWRLGGIWLVAVLAIASAALAVGGLLLWSTTSADQLSRERQQHLVSTVLSQSVAGVAHDQESVTVWDDSIHRLRARPLDQTWLDRI